jgi:polygalacturonase
MTSAAPWSTIAAGLARLPGPRIPERDFPATAHGLEFAASLATDALPALRAAIAACHAAGGGRVLVPPGDYLLRGPLVLLSRVNLHLARGATLRFSGDPADFLPPVPQRWEGTEVFSHSPLITARDATDIALTGDGVIDGAGSRVFTSWQPLQGPDQFRLRQLGHDCAPLSSRVFGAGTRLRPSLFQPLGCERVLVEGLTFRDSPFWVLHPTFCRHVVIRGVTVESLNHNNDGCDPDSCSDVLIEGCTFRTGDDGIAIKSGRDQDAWRVARPTERVLVRDCDFHSRINGLCVGSEMSGDVRHVFMENCRVHDAYSALYLKANTDRGGAIEDVFIRNIQIGRARSALLRLDLAYKHRRDGAHPAALRRVSASAIRCADADTYGLYLEGVPGHPVSDVSLSDITIDRCAEPVWRRHVSGLRLDRVLVNGTALPANPPEAAPRDAPREIRM